MPSSNVRLRYTLEEILGMLPVGNKEVEVQRTNDFGDTSSPNWESSLKRFSLGLSNSQASITSNMITDKMRQQTDTLISYLDRQQIRLFDFFVSTIERILNNILGLLKKDTNQKDKP